MLVYTYFQIPLMVIVFLPALDGIRPQWREATESLGGTTWQYWRRVAGPLLAPAFLGSTLLLFANAFSAYATAAALVSQGSVHPAAADPQRADQRGRARPAEPRQGDGARHGRRGRHRHGRLRAAAAEGRPMAGDERPPDDDASASSAGCAGWCWSSRRVFFLLPAGRDGRVQHPAHGVTFDTWRAAGRLGQAVPGLPELRRRHRSSRCELVVLTVRADAGAAGADHDLGAAAAARACAGRRVPLPAAADHPGDRAGGRAGAGLRVGHLLPRPSSVWLCFAYIILVLPYAYRAIDAGLSAIDVKTLSEAARSLGASWPR